MTDPIETVTDLAAAAIDAFLEASEEAVEEVSGMVEPTAEQLAAFFFEMQTLWPPMPFRYPDGRVVTASPWILALGECENGDEWLKRFDSFIARNGGGI